MVDETSSSDFDFELSTISTMNDSEEAQKEAEASKQKCCIIRLFGLFGRLFRFIGKVLNSPIFFKWLTIGFLLFLTVACVDFGTDVNVAIDITKKYRDYTDFLHRNSLRNQAFCLHFFLL